MLLIKMIKKSLHYPLRVTKMCVLLQSQSRQTIEFRVRRKKFFEIIFQKGCECQKCLYFCIPKRRNWFPEVTGRLSKFEFFELLKSYKNNKQHNFVLCE